MQYKSELVYQIPCSRSKKYTGMTIQYLHKRIVQHKNDVKNKQDRTALVKHSLSEQHHFKFDDTKILDIEPNEKKLEISEMIYIKADRDNCNFRTDTQYLSNMYSFLIDDFGEFLKQKPSKV